MSIFVRTPRQVETVPVEPRDGSGTGAPPRPAARVSNFQEEPYVTVRKKVHSRLLSEVNLLTDNPDAVRVRQDIQGIYSQVLAEEKVLIARAEREELLEQIVAEILGFGPIEQFLADPTVTEVMVNGCKFVYIEREGKIERTQVEFEDDDHVQRIIQRIVGPLGRRIDESSPMVDARLPDGSRVNAIIPPLALNGPVITIRKFAKTPLTVAELTRNGTFDERFVNLMKGCIQGRLNIIISGGTGSGKTTTLNVLSGFLPATERIVTIEDAAELQLRQDHVVRLESRPSNIEGKGQVTIRNLVVNALRMRPDRIVVGEVRSGEALDMLQAMNTGHDGSLTTLHANGPRDALRRLETMVLMAGMESAAAGHSRADRQRTGRHHPDGAHARRHAPHHLRHRSPGDGRGRDRDARYLRLRADGREGWEDPGLTGANRRAAQVLRAVGNGGCTAAARDICPGAQALGARRSGVKATSLPLARTRRNLGWPLPGITLDRLWLCLPGLGLVIVLGLTVIRPYDFWWHLRTGQIIVQTGQIPTLDGFSFTRAGSPWLNQAWLMQAAFYLAYLAGGLATVIALHTALIAGGYLALQSACSRVGRSGRAVAGALLLAAAAGCLSWNVRPQSITFLLMGVLIYLLERNRGGDRRALWAVPPLFLIWGNAHGGWIFGLALLACYGVGTAYERRRKPALAARELSPLVLSGALAVACLAITPAGPGGMAAYALGFTGNDVTMGANVEFQPLSFRTSDGALVISIAAILVGLAFGRKTTVPAGPVLAALFFGFGTLYSQRMAPWFGMAAAPLAAQLLEERFSSPASAGHPHGAPQCCDTAVLDPACTGQPAVVAGQPPDLRRAQRVRLESRDAGWSRCCVVQPGIRHSPVSFHGLWKLPDLGVSGDAYIRRYTC